MADHGTPASLDRTLSGPTVEEVVRLVRLEDDRASMAGYEKTGYYWDQSQPWPTMTLHYERVPTFGERTSQHPEALLMMAAGVAIALVAGIVSYLTYADAAAHGGGTYVVFWGAVVFGLLLAGSGVSRLGRPARRAIDYTARERRPGTSVADFRTGLPPSLQRAAAPACPCACRPAFSPGVDSWRVRPGASLLSLLRSGTEPGAGNDDRLSILRGIGQ